MVTTAPELLYNPYSFAVHDDPYDTYRRLRDEAPDYWNPDLRFWALSRFGRPRRVPRLRDVLLGGRGRAGEPSTDR